MATDDIVFKRVEDNGINKAADIESGNYKVFLSALDIDRTLRIYKSLVKLSKHAVEAAEKGQHGDFSLYTDKMRPLMGYIADNNVKLSNFLDNNNPMTSEILARDPSIRESVQTLIKNLKTIESVRKAMGSVPFNSAFLVSRELTNAFIDFKLELAWDYEHDPIILINLSEMALIDFLVERGQKRFIVAGGNIQADECKSVIQTGGTLFKLPDYQSLKKQGGMPAFPGRPLVRFAIFDMGTEKISDVETREIAIGIHHGRNDQWGKFNTINRADTTRILNNLTNMAHFEQTSVLHDKFKDKAAVIVSPGPSLEKNLNTLKKVKGKALIICVLHALKDLQRMGIEPDFVVHVDPVDLKTIERKKDGKVISLWDQWIDQNDLSKISHFVVSNYQKPNMFEIPAKNVMWMSSGLPIGDLLPLEVFDYVRVGGSVSHAAFDLAVELGCSSIALVGQDLAYSKGGANYSQHANLGDSLEDQAKAHMKVYGNDVEAEGWNGETVISNNTYISFGQAFEMFARELDEKDIKLFNCSEGGLNIKGFNHCKLSTFIEKELGKNNGIPIAELLIDFGSAKGQKNLRIEKTKKFIVKNRTLAREIGDLIKVLIGIAEKLSHDDNDLRKFDKLQNRMIKKMGSNKFYSLGLQRDIHILTAGLKADSSVGGQLGFHLDFLKVSQDLNKRFMRQLSYQLNQINKNSH